MTAHRLGRRHRAALRRLLRPRHEPQQRPAGGAWSRSSASASSRWSATARGVWSFVHIDDAAAATVAAVEHGATGHLPRRRRRARAGARLAADAGRGARRQAAAAPAALARPAGRRRGRGRHDDRGAGRVERQGEARAGLAAASTRAGGRASRRGSGERRGPLRRAAAGRVRDRLPDARQRERGGGRGAGGVPPPPPRAERRRADRVAARVPVRRWSRGSGIDQLRSARVRRETYVGEWLPEPLRRGDDPAPPRRDGRLAVARVPRAAREPLARAARGVPAARGLRLPLRRDRARSSARARTTRASSRPARAATSRSAGRATRPRARPASSSPTASSPPSARATSRRSRSCSPRTSCCTATAAARRRRWPGRCTGATASRARCGAWASARVGASAACLCAASRSTASRARCTLDPEGRLINVLALDIADGRIQAIRSVVNPDKLRHLGDRWPTSTR